MTCGLGGFFYFFIFSVPLMITGRVDNSSDGLLFGLGRKGEVMVMACHSVLVHARSLF